MNAGVNRDMGNRNYIETIPCPICGFAENKPILMETAVIGAQNCSLGINECKACQSCYVSPRLNVDGLSLLYNEKYMEQTVSGAYNVNEKVSELEYSQFAKYLAKEFPSGGSVLDVGCGVGLMLDAIAKDCPNLKAEGVEFSKFAGQEAQKKGYNVHIGEFTQMEHLPPASFDGIIILYVLEHVPDPMAVLRKCRSLLKQRGKLFVAVPNYRYLKLTHAGIAARVLYGKPSNLFSIEHLFNFTPVTLARILEKSGFVPLYLGQAKPLRAGTVPERFLKLIFSGFFDLMFKLGYQLGGIHVVAGKKEKSNECS